MNKKTLSAILAIAFCIPAFSASTNKTTEKRTSATVEVPMLSILMPALEELAAENETAHLCLDRLNMPSVDFGGKEILVGVSVTGETADPDLNKILSKAALEATNCSVALAARIEVLHERFATVKPTRIQAIAMAKEFLDDYLDHDFFSINYSNSNVAKMPVKVEIGNNGYSQEFMTMEKCYANQCSVVTTTGKHLINGAPNREFAKGGIYAWFTNPTRLNFVCLDSAPVAKQEKKNGRYVKDLRIGQVHRCEAIFVVKFDGTRVNVTKSGQRWFDQAFIGGATYSIAISGEKGEGTNTQVQTKGGW